MKRQILYISILTLSIISCTTTYNTTYEYLEKTKCKYCGGNCPNEDESSAWICEGYRNDPDGLYA